MLTHRAAADGQERPLSQSRIALCGKSMAALKLLRVMVPYFPSRIGWFF